MSSNQREEKIYGAVETEDHITFTGFCKRIYSKEIQTVDIFINEEKVTSIKANEEIKEIEDIYDVYDTNNYCFKYQIPNNMVGDKHLIEFKNLNSENLLHSPIYSLCKEDPNYEKYLFIKEINAYPFNDIKLKNYKKGSIGFLVIEDNLKDLDFINYINRLSKRFSQLKFKLFYLEDDCKEKCLKLININSDQCKYIKPSNIEEITNEIEIWIQSSKLNTPKIKNLNKLFKFFIENCENIYCINYNKKVMEKKLTQFDYENINHEVFNNYDFFNFSKNEIKKSKNSLSKLLIHRFTNINTEKMNIEEFFDLRIKCALDSNEFKKFMTDWAINLRLFKENKNKASK